jgi:hypothetical protein
MHKLVGRVLLAGAVLFAAALGTIAYLNHQVSQTDPPRAVVSQESGQGAPAVLSEQDRQQLAKQDQERCLAIVSEETQKALSKAANITDPQAAARYTQQVLADQKAQTTHCQASYP